MYAVIESGGKQFRVELGSEIEVDTMDGEPGSTIELGRVLLVADGDDAQIGRPVVEGARVSANVVRQDRGPKLVVFKYRPKARHRAKHGHRQGLTLLRVSDIVLGGRSAARQEEAARTERERYAAAAEAEAARKASADQALARKLARQAEAEKEEKEAVEAPARGRGRAGIPVRGRRSAGREEPAAKASAGTAAKRSDRATAPSAAKGASGGASTRKTSSARTGGAKASSREPARRTQAGGATARTTAARKPAGKSAAQRASGGKPGSRGTGSTGRTQASKTQPKRRPTRGK